MSSGNQRYINTAGTHDITMNDNFINVSTSVGAITLVFPNIRDSGAIPTNKVWFVNDVDDMAATNNVTIVASDTSPVTELNGGTSVVLDTNGFSAEIVPSGYYNYMVNAGIGSSTDSSLPKVYKALLTQTGTSAPVATVLVNTLSGTPVWSYSAVGQYAMTLNGEFLAAKTIVLGSSYNVDINRSNDDAILVSSFSSRVEEDDILGNTTIIIEVYP